MRTTLTLDDDVAAQLKRLERTQNRSFKELVNTALREGLARLEQGPARARARFRTKSLKLGACKVGSIDDVSEVLAIAEGELHR
jgi:hypothetical protein